MIMTWTSDRANRRTAIASTAVAAALALLAAGVAGAQATTPTAGAPRDIRWQPLLGCWKPVLAPNAPAWSDDRHTSHLVCIVPVTGGSAVDIVTLNDGREATRERLEPSGTQPATTKDGCTGSRSAFWSAAGDRLYLRSEYTCLGGVTRRSTGLLALSPDGELLEIEGVGAGKRTAIQVLRFQEAPVPSALAGEFASLSRDRVLGTDASRALASVSLTAADIVDAAQNVDAPVVEAWLVERQQSFKVDAKLLTALADAGVPGSVTDMMIALSYPKTFAINAATRAGDFRADTTQRRPTVASSYARPPIMLTMPGYYADDYLAYGLYPYGYSRYAGYRYGYGDGYFGYGYGWYPPGGVVIVRNPDPNGEARAHGRVVNRRGYTNAGSSPGAEAVPRESRGASSSSGAERGGSSSGDGSSSRESGGGSSSSGGGRTAKPRP